MEEKNSEPVVETEKKPKKSFKETVTLMIRKKWLSNTAETIVLVAVLIAVFLGINLYVQSLELDTIDVTKNKIYTLSDASKEVIKNIDKDVKIYLYGIEDGSTLANFVKQYSKVNDHIKWEILTEESNLAKVQEFDLSSGYQIIVIESGGANKIIDTSYELYSYDYTTGQEVDLTEQTITNSILAMTTDKKPKVYFSTGHEEYDLGTELTILSTYLQNEAYDASSINLLTEGKVPDDCDLLVIMAPVKDFVEQEVDSVLAYINRGGDIILTMDVGNIGETYPNLQKVYDQYGTNLNHSGYVYETNSEYALSNYPNIFMPEVSATNDATSDIYTDGSSTLWLVYAGRLTFASDDQLQALNVTRDDILTSSDDSLFVTDITQATAEAAKSAEKGKSVIASELTKTITPAEGETEAVESKAIIVANASFITDYKVEQLSQSYPISYLANNKDFMLNSIASLTKKENTLKIRKDMSSSTYAPTEEEHRVVMVIIFAVPVLIIVIGIVVWQLRRRKR